ncbi:YkgJ family cysteine cluster protein [Desulfoprunum benzoelyticum]|uniref:Fe-S-cluster containining protein n=1 Tax=Desulfoprunum benzoelyticum TaxID=1506996 RepID=A0A840UVF3_9BACT|nr:YkgJ family cysteine cluster protein [Desulfoprunum benzoelyticum]MBB5348816.1 Fe-S-cluster containining protein [Desulfoprunum benzoelyticum]MBM9529978.1 YkgJ family cysteine cluster protein [Desulfoprunum benzoelyticum]
MTTGICQRCGSCCLQGGPALHRTDLPLIKKGRIPLDRLITIRKGELADNPVAGGVQATRVELVKIAGSGRDWRCCYYDEAAGCLIYAHRPQACKVLKCWDTTAILALVETDVLSRLDIVAVDDPLRPLIMEHERECPCPDLELLERGAASVTAAERAALQALVARDLAFREEAVRRLGLSLGLELFAFGRPIFQLLQPFGIRVAMTAAGPVLQWP